MQNVGIKLTATDEASGVFARVSQEAGKLGSSVTAVGGSFTALASTAIAGLSVISFGAQVNQAIDLADSFNKLSQKTGIAVEDLSRLKYAANLADVSTEGLAGGIKKLNVNISAAANGSKEQAAVFKALGINIKDAAGNVLGADKVFAQLADVFAGSADGANKTAIAVALLGKNGADLVPLLNAGAGGLKNMGDEAKKLGIVMSADFAKNAEEFKDNLTKIRIAGDGLFVTLASDLVKGLGDTAKAMADAAVEGGKYAAVIAGIQTLLTGTDEYKNNKALVENTEALLRLENQRLEFKRAGYAEDSRVIKNLDAQLQGVREILKTTQAYRTVLQQAETAREKAAKPTPTGDSAAISAAAKAIGTATGAAAASPYDALNKSIKERLALVSSELAAGRALTDQEKFAAKIATDLAEAKGKITTKQRDSIAAGLEQLRVQDLLLAIDKSQIAAARESAIERQKTRNADYDSVNAYLKSELEARNAAIKALRDGNEALKEEVAVIGLSGQALVDHEMALLSNTIAQKENTAAELEAENTGSDRAKQLRIEIGLLQERRALTAQKGVSNAAAEAARVAAEEWKRTADLINVSLTDALMRGFEDGKGFAENFRDTVANMFKTLVLRPVISAVVSPVAQGLTGALGFSGMANAAGTGSSLLSGASSLSNAANLAGFGSGSSVFTQFATSGVGQSLGLSAGVDAIGGLGTASSALTGAGSAFSAAMPWIGGALLLSQLFSGGGFKSSAPTGSNVSNFDASGALASYRTGSSDPSAGANKVVADLQASYIKSAMALGISTAATSFSYAGNTGAQGESPNFALGGGTAARGFYQSETGLSDAAVSLAASRAVFAALQGSELPQYLSSVFNSLDAGAASQDQITNTLAFANGLKSVRDALTETRTPLQILQDNLAAGTAALHTTAESFKTDFVAAIDAGIGADSLAQWQALQTTMTDLAAATGKADSSLVSLGRSIADIANERTRLQDQYDQLTMSSEQMLAKQRSAIDASNLALFDQVQAQIALKDAATAAAEAATATAAAYVAAAEAQRNAAAQRLTQVTSGAADAFAGVQRAVAAQRLIESATIAAQKETAAAIYKAQASALQTSMDTVKTSLDAVGDSVGKLQSLSGTLKSTLDGLRLEGADAAYRAEAQAQIAAALGTVRAGGALPLGGQLDSALRTISQPSEQLFSKFSDYAFDFLKTKADVGALSGFTDSQLSSQEATLALLRGQSNSLEDQSKLLKDGFTEQVSTLDDILGNAQKQLDAAYGLNTSVLSVADAIGAFNGSVLALTTERARQDLATSRGTTYSADQITGGVKAMLASGASVSQIYDTGARDYGLGASAITAATTGQGLLGFDAATGTKVQDYGQAQIADAIKAFMAVGATPADVYRVGGADYGLSPAEIARAARAAGIPGFRVGTNRIPQDMLALLHKDEAVVPAQYNPAAGGVGNTARLEALVATLIDRVAALEAPLLGIETSNAEHRDLMDRVTEGGNGMRTEVMNAVTLA